MLSYMHLADLNERMSKRMRKAEATVAELEDELKDAYKLIRRLERQVAVLRLDDQPAPPARHEVTEDQLRHEVKRLTQWVQTLQKQQEHDVASIKLLKAERKKWRKKL